KSPSASDIAPVRVARSMTCVAPCSRAYQSASASTSRPSASVLTTSIVLPFIALTMSPGRYAWPPGMFSVAATTASTRTGSCRSAIAHVAAITAAPPDMSPFMFSMCSDGFSEMPCSVHPRCDPRLPLGCARRGLVAPHEHEPLEAPRAVLIRRAPARRVVRAEDEPVCRGARLLLCADRQRRIDDVRNRAADA